MLVRAGWCRPSIAVEETSRSLNLLASQSSQIMSSRFSKQLREKDIQLRSLALISLPSYIYVHMHENTEYIPQKERESWRYNLVIVCLPGTQNVHFPVHNQLRLKFS